MVARAILGSIAGLLLAAAAAQASEATMVADRAGFLIGHAHRCGVEQARLEGAARLADELITAFASDESDKGAAQSQFGDRVVASGLAPLLGQPLPSCKVVRAQLARLERHQAPTNNLGAAQGEQTMAKGGTKDKNAGEATRKTASGAPAARRPAATSREDLTAEERAELELKRAAQEERGRPPSI